MQEAHADKMVELEIVDAISQETVRQAPKHELKPSATSRRDAHSGADGAQAPGALGLRVRTRRRALFMLNEPLRGWRGVVVGDQRTTSDWAYVVKHLVEVHYAAA